MLVYYTYLYTEKHFAHQLPIETLFLFVTVGVIVVLYIDNLLPFASKCRQMGCLH